MKIIRLTGFLFIEHFCFYTFVINWWYRSWVFSRNFCSIWMSWWWCGLFTRKLKINAAYEDKKDYEIPHTTYQLNGGMNEYDDLNIYLSYEVFCCAKKYAFDVWKFLTKAQYEKKGGVFKFSHGFCRVDRQWKLQ